jgi:D-3-phosphoglycerate dehydrogenase / 2-oxoglutarate reductase
MKKLFIATSSFNEMSSKKISFYHNKKLKVIKNPLKRKLDTKNLLNLAKDADYIIAGTEEYNKETIDKLRKLKFIFRLGSGTDNVDLDFLKLKNIKFNKSRITPEISVAELIVGYIITTLRKIHTSDQDLKEKKWKKEMGSNLHEKTVGIIGFGKVGRYLNKLLKSFGAKVLVNDIKLAKNKNINLKYLLKNSDIVSINTSSIGKKILNKSNLSLLKKNCLLINTSRPEVLDYNFLYKLLLKKKILGAALDVFEEEPYYGKFCKLNNVILTPHIGGYSKEIRSKMELEALKECENFLK